MFLKLEACNELKITELKCKIKQATFTNLKNLFTNGSIQMYSFRLEANVVFAKDSYHAYFIVYTTDNEKIPFNQETTLVVTEAISR